MQVALRAGLPESRREVLTDLPNPEWEGCPAEYPGQGGNWTKKNPPRLAGEDSLSEHLLPSKQGLQRKNLSLLHKSQWILMLRMREPRAPIHV